MKHLKIKLFIKGNTCKNLHTNKHFVGQHPKSVKSQKIIAPLLFHSSIKKWGGDVFGT